jgi:hypothetical protein
MVLGYNHNLMYKGEIFHVQTEDSGVTNPHIITLLYRGGVILSSKKTSYADILKMDKLKVVVEELMKEQHKEMMRRLKAGDFDEKAFSCNARLIENYEIPALVPEADPIAELFSATTSSGSATKGNVSLLFELPQIPVHNDRTLQAGKSDSPGTKSGTGNPDNKVFPDSDSRDK